MLPAAALARDAVVAVNVDLPSNAGDNVIVLVVPVPEATTFAPVKFRVVPSVDKLVP